MASIQFNDTANSARANSSSPNDKYKHRLNARGKEIVEMFLNTHLRPDKSITISLEERKNVIQRVIDAGNPWFSMKNVRKYIKRRQKVNARPDSKNDSQYISNEEELLFGSIEQSTRRNLRNLFLARVDPNTYEYWANEHGIQTNELKAFFEWLQMNSEELHESPKDLFPDLSPDVKEKLKKLLVDKPDATELRKGMWATRFQVSRELALAYFRHVLDNELGADRSNEQRASGSQRVRDTEGNDDNTREAANLLSINDYRLPTPVSPTPPRRIPSQQTPPKEPKQELSMNDIDLSIRQAGKTELAPGKHVDKSPEVHLQLNSETFQQEETPASPEIPHGPILLQHPLATSVSPVLGTNVHIHSEWSISPSPLPSDGTFEHTKSTGLNHAEIGEERLPSRSATPAASPSIPKVSVDKQLRVSGSDTHAKTTLKIVAACIDDLQIEMEGINKIRRRRAELEPGQALPKADTEEMDVDENAAEIKESEAIQHSKGSHTNDGEDITMLDAKEADEARTTCEAIKKPEVNAPQSNPGQQNASVASEEADGRMVSCEVRSAMDIDLAPRPTNIHELLEWIKMQQKPLDKIFKIAEQIKEARGDLKDARITNAE